MADDMIHRLHEDMKTFLEDHQNVYSHSYDQIYHQMYRHIYQSLIKDFRINRRDLRQDRRYLTNQRGSSLRSHSKDLSGSSRNASNMSDIYHAYVLSCGEYPSLEVDMDQVTERLNGLTSSCLMQSDGKNSKEDPYDRTITATTKGDYVYPLNDTYESWTQTERGKKKGKPDCTCYRMIL